MKILHITDLGLLGRRNGITEVIENILRTQRNLGYDVYFFNIRNNGKLQISETNRVTSSLKLFKKEIGSIKPNIVIFHSLYFIKYVFFASYLNKLNIPYLVQIHGGASSYAQNKGKIKKMIANKLLFNNVIKQSNGIIFLSKKEQEKAVVFKHLAPNIIIPNGCYLPDIQKHRILDDNVLHFIYLARIDIYIKGIDVLLDAIHNIYDKIKGKVIFDFYGYTYDDTFLNMIKPFADVVKYHNAVYDEKKEKAFRKADVFILTSRSEGMPMSVLEALSYGLPCLITKQTNMGEVVGKDAGWVVDCNPKEISDAILDILNIPMSELQKMSNNARNAAIPYSWDEIGKLSISEYKKVIGYKN